LSPEQTWVSRNARTITFGVDLFFKLRKEFMLKHKAHEQRALAIWLAFLGLGILCASAWEFKTGVQLILQAFRG